jgi:hypothetical protein
MNKQSDANKTPINSQFSYGDEHIKAKFIRNGEDIEISISAKILQGESLDDATKRILGALKYKLENF